MELTDKIGVALLLVSGLLLAWSGLTPPLPKLALPEPDVQVRLSKRAGTVILCGVLTGVFIFFAMSPVAALDVNVVGMKLSALLAGCFALMTAVLFGLRLKYHEGVTWFGPEGEIQLNRWALALITPAVSAFVIMFIHNVFFS